jgi:glucan phosphoethanolaminetransferase (alkaline phosphatase superfamily)
MPTAHPWRLRETITKSRTRQRAGAAPRLLAALVPLALFACGAPSPEVRSAPQAVVLFLIDTLRADYVGAFGGPRSLTPHLDALAQRSVVFENAHAPAPWTLPSVT